jgi:ABC-2 type transport system ATP-binding protein
MIALAAVTARSAPERGRPPAFVRNVTLEHARGVLAVVGARVDGTTLLLALLAGRARPQSGRVTVLGGDPEAMRARIAHVPADVVLPDALRVDEVCALGARARGEAPKTASEVLSPLGLEPLAKRRVSSLTRPEARAVALALALASSASLLLVEEPLTGLEPAATSRVTGAIRARAAANAIVVVTTASVRDATRLGDHLSILTQGVLAPLPPELAHVGHEGARLRVVVAPRGDAAALVAALAADPAVATIETMPFAAPARSDGATPVPASAVVVTGRDLLALASAINRAAAERHVDVEAIESAVMPLDAIRAAIAAPRTGPLPSRPPPSMPPASMPPASTPPPSRGGPS